MRANPLRDWYVLLGVAVLLLVGILFTNARVYGVIASGAALGGAPADLPTFTAVSLGEMHALFDARAREAGKYTAGIYRYADPSQ